jgi:hypothetical protein
MAEARNFGQLLAKWILGKVDRPLTVGAASLSQTLGPSVCAAFCLGDVYAEFSFHARSSRSRVTYPFAFGEQKNRVRRQRQLHAAIFTSSKARVP